MSEGLQGPTASNMLRQRRIHAGVRSFSHIKPSVFPQFENKTPLCHPRVTNSNAKTTAFMSSFPLITLEEHYISRKAITASNSSKIYAAFPSPIVSKLEDLDEKRIADMDAGGISLQIISHGPLDASPALCVEANSHLAAAISKHPTRMKGFAMLPMCSPELAAQELERCVRDLGLVGALVDNHLDGRFYDDERFWPVFAKAEALDVPLYIHPTFAPREMTGHYQGNYSDEVAQALSAYGWGWHSETGLHFLRLWCAGVFDRFPKLKIIIGHMGELVPFQLERIVAMEARLGSWERGLREVWRGNVWVTTSGMFALAPLACLLQTTSKEHVLFSVDYPFSANEKGRSFVEEVRRSGMLTEEEMRGFVGGNAERLLGVKATS